MAIPGREDSGVTGPLIDPEELSDAPEAPAGRAEPQQGPAPLASPSPVPSSSRKLPDFFEEPEELLKSDKGVLLSVPLTPAEQAKAMSETATALCDNTCSLSYESDTAFMNFISAVGEIDSGNIHPVKQEVVNTFLSKTTGSDGTNDFCFSLRSDHMRISNLMIL